MFTATKINIKKIATIICCMLVAAFLCLQASYNYILEWDECFYVNLGKNLATGKGYTIAGKPHLHFPPFYPLMIMIFYKLIKNLELAAKAVSFISFLLAIPVFFKLVLLICNKYIACIATFLFSTHFFIIDYSYRALSHSIDILLVILILFFGSLILTSKTVPYRYFIAFSVICSFAILNRPENIILTIVSTIYIILNIKCQFKKKVLAMLVTVILMFIIMFPYAYFLYKHTGMWTVTTKLRLIKHYECVLNNTCQQTPVNVPFRFSLLAYLKNNFKSLIIRYLYTLPKFLEQLSKISYGGIGLFIIGIGFVKLLRRNFKIEFFLILSLTPLLIMPFGVCYFRFFLFAIPTFIYWIAYGLFKLIFYVKKNFQLSYRSAFLILSILVLSLSFISRLIYYRIFENKDFFSSMHRLTALKEMGFWIRKNIKDIDTKKLVDVSPIVAFYAGIDCNLINNLTDKEQLFLYLKKNKINFLCVNDYYIKRKLPWFSFLIDENLKNENLIKMHEIRDKIIVILYKVKHE